MGHGAAPGERRGGRQKGARNLRTLAATEIVTQAQEQFPAFNPVAALMALAEATDTDPALARDCYATLLPYMVPRFRPIEADIDRLVELERRIQAVKTEATIEAHMKNPGLANLADRLERAALRAAEVETRVRDIEEIPASTPMREAWVEPTVETPTLDEAANADLAARLERAAERSAAEPEPEPYRPITRAPKPRPFGGKAS